MNEVLETVKTKLTELASDLAAISVDVQKDKPTTAKNLNILVLRLGAIYAAINSQRTTQCVKCEKRDDNLDCTVQQKA